MRATPQKIKEYLEQHREIIDTDPRLADVDVLLERGIRGVRELSYIGTVILDRKRNAQQKNKGEG